MVSDADSAVAGLSTVVDQLAAWHGRGGDRMAFLQRSCKIRQLAAWHAVGGGRMASRTEVGIRQLARCDGLWRGAGWAPPGTRARTRGRWRAGVVANRSRRVYEEAAAVMAVGGR